MPRLGLWEQRREARAGLCRLVVAQPWGSTPLLSPLPGSDPTLARPLNSLVSSTCEIPPVVLTHTVSPSWKHPGSPSPVCPQPCSGGALLGHSWDPIAPHGVVPKAAPGQPSDFLCEASTGTPSCPPGSPLSSLPKPSASSIKDRNGMDLTEAGDIKKRWQEYTEEL